MYVCSVTRLNKDYAYFLYFCSDGTCQKFCDLTGKKSNWFTGRPVWQAADWPLFDDNFSCDVAILKINTTTIMWERQ